MSFIYRKMLSRCWQIFAALIFSSLILFVTSLGGFWKSYESFHTNLKVVPSGFPSGYQTSDWNILLIMAVGNFVLGVISSVAAHYVRVKNCQNDDK